jgi:pimeloyl-ACP methyl ester carboxylesterase
MCRRDPIRSVAAVASAAVARAALIPLDSLRAETQDGAYDRESGRSTSTSAGGTEGDPASRGGEARTPFILAPDGTRLFYRDWGVGVPVVFLHSWGLNADMWEYQMLPLSSRGLRCVAYDRRGHGRSDQPWHGYDYDTLADDLAAVLDRLDLHDVTLVGHSMAGGEIARYLVRHGTNRVARVALIATTLPFLLRTPDHPQGLDRSVFDATIAKILQDRPRFFADGAPAFFGVDEPADGRAAVSGELMRWAVELSWPASPKALVDCVRAFSETDFRPDLRAFTMPTLIVHGDADRSAPIDLTGRPTASAVQGSRFHVFAGVPHGLFITHKDRLNQELLEFIGP